LKTWNKTESILVEWGNKCGSRSGIRKHESRRAKVLSLRMVGRVVKESVPFHLKQVAQQTVELGYYSLVLEEGKRKRKKNYHSMHL
jgi:hypothetical protein